MLVGKKGILPELVLVVVIVWFGASIYFFNEAMVNQEATLGDVQLSIMETFSSYDKDRIFDKHVLNQKFSDAFVDYADSGAIFEGKSKDGYTYWKKGSFECYPGLNSLETNLILFLDEYFENEFKGTYLFDLIFSSDKILVEMSPLNEYIGKGLVHEVRFDPDSKTAVFFNYDITSILDSVSEVQRVVLSCGDDTSCWRAEATFNWVKDNNIYKVEIISDRITGVLGEKEVVLKAAVDFSPVNPLVDGDLKCLA